MAIHQQCYLCGDAPVRLRHPRTRDREDIQVFECEACGLVFLSSQAQVSGAFYENSEMYGGKTPDPLELAKGDESDLIRQTSALKSAVSGKRYLDFGSGSGGMLARLSAYTQGATGIEINRHMSNYCRTKLGLDVRDSVEDLDSSYDVISMFHVLEHMPDPCNILRRLGQRLSPDGFIYIEVPNANDALLTLFQCESFKNFSYWSPHLFLFTDATLSTVIDRAGLKLQNLEQVQRYPLANHLYWLSQGRPGGHDHWHFLSSPALNKAYESALGKSGFCDTIVAKVGLNTRS